MAHIKQSRSDDLYEINNNNNNNNNNINGLKLLRRHTEPPSINNYGNHHKLNNNYYSQIRFHRRLRSDSDYYDDNNKKKKRRLFPDGNRIKDYIHFREKYRFIMQGQNRKLLGYGAMSAVYKVYLLKNRNKKYAAKISSYKDQQQKKQIMEENRLLHKFGNGLEIKDIYDDTINKRMIFIQPNGKDLKSWWNNGAKIKFKSENTQKQEIIIKKILYQILLNLKYIHDCGYIHHDIKPQNILVTKNKNNNNDWIDEYKFHIIDYGLSIPCKYGENIELNKSEIRFGTFGYNAWELMKTHEKRKYNHSIDLYALGITICELIIGKHCLRNYNNFKSKQEIFCYSQLITNYNQYQQDSQQFNGFTDYDIYAQTLRLKCNYWRQHFSRNNGISRYNGDESIIRSIVIKELQYKTSYTTRFKNFISNLIRDNPQKRISNVDNAINHDLFYNV